MLGATFLGPQIGYFGFESFGFGFHGFKDHNMIWSSVSQSVVHKSFVSSGGLSANCLETSEDKEIFKNFVHKYLINLKCKIKYNSHWGILYS